MRDREGRFRFIVNLQGDLPTVEPLAVQRCLGGLVNEGVDISTIAAPITDEADVANPNIVKAIAPLSDEREVAYRARFPAPSGGRSGPRLLASHRHLCLSVAKRSSASSSCR